MNEAKRPKSGEQSATTSQDVCCAVVARLEPPARHRCVERPPTLEMEDKAPPHPTAPARHRTIQPLSAARSGQRNTRGGCAGAACAACERSGQVFAPACLECSRAGPTPTASRSAPDTPEDAKRQRGKASRQENPPPDGETSSNKENRGVFSFFFFFFSFFFFFFSFFPC